MGCQSSVVFLPNHLSFTGLMNWLVLPKGYQARGSGLVSFRHFLTDIHEWTALLFMITIAIHIVLHWEYIRTHLRKPGDSLKSDK